MQFEVSQTINWKKTILTENLTRKLKNWIISYCYLNRAMNNSVLFCKLHVQTNWKRWSFQVEYTQISHPLLILLAFIDITQ